MTDKTYTVTAKGLFETLRGFSEMSDDEVAQLVGMPREEFFELSEEEGYVTIEALLNKHHS